ncbi:hypothetical protein MADE_000001022655 [Alteromonas mediterranea DE]|uniref:Uncharacterized protein n=1 Tax=Alteromonas mediterranea (strain DSM 17117 / CIP 110805 / LMG 28347 / Deep ecotype) TaxID=1774373 RepID=T2DMR7_ALTMD|nr:hypothetical protein MADE_000001022655 [Alteromonas mediterranea DE]|tara:strand:+ start:123 stop:302 length:180 start_codon:yes stop_codon:yes gene_type:complete
MLGLSVFYEFKRPNDRGFRLDAKMFKKIEKSFYKRLKARKATCVAFISVRFFLKIILKQ